MKISFLLLLSVSLSTHAGERLQGISDSMGKSANSFSQLFGNDTQNQNVDTTGKRQREEITVETKLEAELEAAKIKDGERHHGIKDDSASFGLDQEKKSAKSFIEIDIISDINAEFEDTINKLEATEAKPTIKNVNKIQTETIINNSDTVQTKNEDNGFKATNKSNTLHAANEINTTPAASKDCVKEKVYTLDVDNAAQYERLEDFPYTYECVIQR